MSRRDQLVEQMTRSIRENGLGASTIEAILRDSHITAGSMYHYFPGGKEALAAAAVQEAGVAGAALLAETLESASSPAEATRVFYEGLASEMEETDFRFGCPVGVPSTEAASTEAIRAAGVASFESWISAMASALQQHGFTPDRAQSVARFAIAAYEGASTVARTLHDVSVIDDVLAAVQIVLSTPDSE